jgi:hypothetical protein
MPAPTFPTFFAVAGRDGPKAPRRPQTSPRGGMTPWLVALLCAVVASAFFVDVGVPEAPRAIPDERAAALP